MAIDLAPNNPYTLELRSPVIAAAGSLGYGIEYARLLGLGAKDGAHGLGALITRTTTLHPRRATPLPRIVETPAGLLSCGAEHNPGLRAVVERCGAAWASWDLPVLVSIAGASPAECAELAGRLEGVEGVTGVEINLAACGASLAGEAAKVVAAARAATRLPLLARLPGQAPDITGAAQAAAAAGADALVVAGGPVGLASDPEGGPPLRGELRGPAIRPLALALVAAVAPAVAVPVVGMGGIGSAGDARAFLETGAVAVALGAALLADPRAAARVAAGLAEINHR